MYFFCLRNRAKGIGRFRIMNYYWTKGTTTAVILMITEKSYLKNNYTNSKNYIEILSLSGYLNPCNIWVSMPFWFILFDSFCLPRGSSRPHFPYSLCVVLAILRTNLKILIPLPVCEDALKFLLSVCMSSSLSQYRRQYSRQIFPSTREDKLL